MSDVGDDVGLFVALAVFVAGNIDVPVVDEVVPEVDDDKLVPPVVPVVAIPSAP